MTRCLKAKVPKPSLSQICGVTITGHDQTLWKEAEILWTVKRSNQVSPVAVEFSPEGLIFLILLCSNPITELLR